MPNKLEKLNEQMAMLWDISHNLENFYIQQKNTTIGFNRQKEQNKRNYKNKPAQSQNDNNSKKSGKKRKREEKEWKDKEVELVRIPTEILEERKKADFCLKCRKNALKWYECGTKTLVTTRVTRSNKKSKDSKSEKTKKEEVKISIVRGLESAEYSEGRIIELADDTEGDYILSE